MKKKLSKTEKDIIVFALRYALDRNTGAVDIVVRHIKDKWDLLEGYTKKQIQREIGNARRMGDISDGYCWITWKELLELKNN